MLPSLLYLFQGWTEWYGWFINWFLPLRCGFLPGPFVKSPACLLSNGSMSLHHPQQDPCLPRDDYSGGGGASMQVITSQGAVRVENSPRVTWRWWIVLSALVSALFIKWAVDNCHWGYRKEPQRRRRIVVDPGTRKWEPQSRARPWGTLWRGGRTGTSKRMQSMHAKCKDGSLSSWLSHPIP